MVEKPVKMIDLQSVEYRERPGGDSDIMRNTAHITTFFNLKENPFALTPDPKYLYLSKNHREVLAHLIYGVKEDKGFIVVVGEVGTGKTTLSRAFINHLTQENVEVGLIYNPALTDLEMLQAINREFKIDSDFDSKSKLIDTLNEFLLKVNGEGRQVVLIVDEAQNLEFSVMEQLRLISNLEMDTGKLIQIILFGQPELEKILSKKELRQLDQRIVVRSLLEPFCRKETIAYIRHRIAIASADGNHRTLFSEGACRYVYKYSGGTPRLINALCFRALLVAFTEDKNQIRRNTIRKAHRDLEKNRYKSFFRAISFRPQTAFLFFILMFTCLGWLYRGSIGDYIRDFEGKLPSEVKKSETAGTEDRKYAAASQQLKPPVKQKEEPIKQQNQPVQQKEDPVKQQTHPVQQKEEPTKLLIQQIDGLTKEENWMLVLKTLYDLWDETWPDESGLNPGDLPMGAKMKVFEVYGNLSRLKLINYPAILELKEPSSGSNIYVILKKVIKNNVVLIGREEIKMPADNMTHLWHGRAFVLWKDFENLPRIIRPGNRGRKISWLQKNMKMLGFYNGEESSIYDTQTVEAVINLQKEFSLRPDGIVGPETKRTLYSLLDEYRKPRLLDSLN